MLPRKLLSAVLAAIFLCSVAIVIVNADNAPLLISLWSRFPDKVIQGQKYEISVTWTNTNQKKSYDGFLLLTATSNQLRIDSSEITLTYNGAKITPKITGKSLQFQLPKQTFAPSTSGYLLVEVQHNALGDYSWTIGIMKS